MNYQNAIIEIMRALLSEFCNHCSDTKVMNQLLVILSDRNKWEKGSRHVFDEIRKKSKKQNKRSEIIQAQFEEASAKTICNLSQPSAPYDPDSPFWVIPKAIALAKVLGLKEIDTIIAKATTIGLSDAKE